MNTYALVIFCTIVSLIVGYAAGYAFGYTDGLKVAEDMMNMLCETLTRSFNEAASRKTQVL